MSTDNAADQADLYLEAFDDPAHPYGLTVMAKDIGRPHSGPIRIGVKTEAGIERRVFTFRKTHHGPIVGVRDGKPLALRMAKFDGDGWLAEWFAVTRAHRVSGAEGRHAPAQHVVWQRHGPRTPRGTPSISITVAVPVRDPRFDWSRPVDGSDPATEWRGYHSLADLPQLTNPPTGWMQNCNTTPFLLTSSGNPDSSRFPRYMVPEGDNWRGLVSRRILDSKPQFTWDDWVRAAFDTYVISADSLLPGLLRDFAADSARERTDWHPGDRHPDAVESAQRHSLGRDDAVRPLAGSGRGWSPSARRAGQCAVARLEREWGRWQVPWGDQSSAARR